VEPLHSAAAAAAWQSAALLSGSPSKTQGSHGQLSSVQFPGFPEVYEELPQPMPLPMPLQTLALDAGNESPQSSPLPLLPQDTRVSPKMAAATHPTTAQHQIAVQVAPRFDISRYRFDPRCNNTDALSISKRGRAILRKAEAEER
jgi:hypothetical protein